MEHSIFVYRTALLLTKSNSLADDITQETFLQVFRNFHQYDTAKPIHPWLYKITLNTTRKILNKQKLSRLIGVNTNTGYVESVEETILNKEFQRELWTEINKLPLKHREIIVLRYFIDLKLNEISYILNIPLGTCKSRLNAALSILRTKLAKNSFSVAIKGEDTCEKSY